MKEQDRARFKANIQWFNQFFDGMRNIYELILQQLPGNFFPASPAFTSENFYFPRQKITPSIPPYYALLVEGFKYALQVITVVDANIISRSGYFLYEPSIIIVVHTQTDKNSWVDEFGLNVIGNKKVEFTQKSGSTYWGLITSRYTANFFTFQVALDNFSDTDNPQTAVNQHIILPLTENLNKGFPVPPV